MSRVVKILLKSLQVIWASPNSFLGLGIGTLGLCFGGRVQFREGCIEYYHGLVEKLLRSIPPGGSTSAMTLGHVIIGQDAIELKRCRQHEQVHVRQYERWGPFFIPVYLGMSLVMRLRKKDPYYDNPFEVEAYAISDPRDVHV